MTVRNLMRVSRTLTILVAVVLILAGSLKLVNFGADDMLEGLQKARLIQHTTLISVTAIICGVLLLIPATYNFGLLMASSYWGGAIVAHLTYDDSFVLPAVFLGILWTGELLRLAALTSGFRISQQPEILPEETD